MWNNQKYKQIILSLTPHVTMPSWVENYCDTARIVLRILNVVSIVYAVR